MDITIPLTDDEAVRIAQALRETYGLSSSFKDADVIHACTEEYFRNQAISYESHKDADIVRKAAAQKADAEILPGKGIGTLAIEADQPTDDGVGPVDGIDPA